MSAARPRRNVAKITTRPQCGGDKLQGLAPHATKFSISGNNNYQYLAQSGDGRDRRLIYLTNQLAGGVGRHRSQFRNNADGPRHGSGCHDFPKLEIINNPHGNVIHVTNFETIIYAGREGTLSLSEGSVTPSYVSRGTHTIRVHINDHIDQKFQSYSVKLTLTDKANNKTTKNLNPFTINTQIFKNSHITHITREEIGAFLRFTIKFGDQKQHNLNTITLSTNQGDISLNKSSISTTTNDNSYSIIAGPFLYGLEYSGLYLTVKPANGTNAVYNSDSNSNYDFSNYTPNGSYKLLEYAYVKLNTNYNNFVYNHDNLKATKDSILPYFRFLPTYDYYRLDLSNLIPISDISFVLDNGDNTVKIASDLSMETSFNLLYFDSNKDLVEKQISAIYSYYNFTGTRLPTSGVRIRDTSNIDGNTFTSNKRNDDYWMWEVSGITPTYSPKWSSNANTDGYIWNYYEPNNSLDVLNVEILYDNYFTDASIVEGYTMINPYGIKKLNDVPIFDTNWGRLSFDGALYLREHNVVSITDLCDTIIDISNTNANFNYNNNVPFRGFLIKDNCSNLINSSLLSENNKMIPITSTMLYPNSNSETIENAVKTMYS